jgi:hypothetical protein
MFSARDAGKLTTRIEAEWMMPVLAEDVCAPYYARHPAAKVGCRVPFRKAGWQAE